MRFRINFSRRYSNLYGRPRRVAEVHVAELNVSQSRIRLFDLLAEDVDLWPPPNQRLQFAHGALGDGEGFQVGERLPNCGSVQFRAFQRFYQIILNDLKTIEVKGEPQVA